MCAVSASSSPLFSSLSLSFKLSFLIAQRTALPLKSLGTVLTGAQAERTSDWVLQQRSKGTAKGP
jgi:hypothetical protein